MDKALMRLTEKEIEKKVKLTNIRNEKGEINTSFA